MSLDSNDTKIHNILSLVKLGSLIIISIVFIKNSVAEQDLILIFNNFNITISFMVKLFIALILSVTYYIWSYIIVKRIKIKNTNNLLYIIESLVFLIFFMWFVWITGKNYSPYKIIFLFIIIPVSIQFGFKYGIIASSIASLFMLVTDLLLEPNQLININFENDIIISSIFIVISWLLSHYVKVQKEYAKQLEYKANTDVLTGLKNHRFFYDKLESLFLDLNNIENLSLIYFDIDYFKDYNDMFGHLRGDVVLKTIGSKLRELLCDDVTIARYGGDEFAIIFQGKTKDQVYEIGEKIRSTIEKMYFEGQEHLTSKNLTVSMGIAIYDEKTNGYVDFIKQADDALYKAKFTNKNKVEVFGSVSNILRNSILGENSDVMSSINTLISVINAKDKYTYGHVERVVQYVELLADKLELPEETKHTLVYGAYIHDIGKINIPEYVLNKKMPLTDDEWKLIKQHPNIGVEVISKVESLSSVVPLIKHHHERFDGTGYPDRLKGENIPYLARILTVADSFDAMTFSRTYKRAMTYKEAIVEIRECSNKQFDPAIAEVFIEVIKELDREKTDNEQ